MVRRALYLTVLVAGVVALTASNAAAGLNRVLFDTEFQGHTFSSTRWNTTVDTHGNRWCAPLDHWINVSTHTCDGLREGTPYGKIDQYGGEAHFTASRGHTFPYVWRGAGFGEAHPSFPRSGDFRHLVRIKYDTLVGTRGAGYIACRWADGTPKGTNRPCSPNEDVFAIWGNADGVEVCLFGHCKDVRHDSATHVFKLDYINNEYNVYDGNNHVLGPKHTSARPNAILLGNSKFAPDVTAWPHIEYDRVTTLVH